jgi:hypothetical protein
MLLQPSAEPAHPRPHPGVLLACPSPLYPLTPGWILKCTRFRRRCVFPPSSLPSISVITLLTPLPEASEPYLTDAPNSSAVDGWMDGVSWKWELRGQEFGNGAPVPKFTAGRKTNWNYWCCLSLAWLGMC